MSSVYNWQLGREMDYPYAAAYPDRQFAFVFNLNRCIGCQSCTMACKSTWTFNKGQEAMWWNNVETKPYGGYPHHWDVKLLNLLDRNVDGRPPGKPAGSARSGASRTCRAGPMAGSPRPSSSAWMPTCTPCATCRCSCACTTRPCRWAAPGSTASACTTAMHSSR